jgi:glycosyltransferase involved in cell wall biosynthesis
MNRPDCLEKALKSIKNSTMPPKEVIVSDDSSVEEIRRVNKKLCDEYGAKYLDGPRRGLSANRNNILKNINSEYILFIDDDVELHPRFIEKVSEFIKKHKGEKVILTGKEIINNESIVEPLNLSFWGYYKKRGGDLKTICINSTVFPSFAFKEALFDEEIFYGTEEREMALKLYKKGFKIIYNPEFYNYHYPSSINRDIYNEHLFFSNFYFGFKRYMFFEPSFFKFIVFAIFSLPKSIIGAMRRKKFEEIFKIIKAYWKAWKKFFPFLLLSKNPFNIDGT